MAANVKEFPIYQTILSEALASKWLPILFFLNAFLTGFLLPTDYYEAGFNSHHWDFIYAITGAVTLFLFSRFFKNPSKILLAIAAASSGLIAAFAPYIFTYLVLPHGIPDSLKSKWVYAFNGPIGQIVALALFIGAIKYGQFVSNSVAENRLTLNHLRSNMQTHIKQEQDEILYELKSKIDPALESVGNAIKSGAKRNQIVGGINLVINQIVRPISHELDAKAGNSKVELDLRSIKSDFRKERFRRRLKGQIPLHLAISAPLSIFLYLNFNLAVISYLHGLTTAFKVGAPFLLFSVIIFFGFRKLVSTKETQIYKALIAGILISILQAVFFYIFASLFKVENSNAGNSSFAFTTFFLTLAPAVFGIVILNMRANLQAEQEITNEIAHDLSTIRGQIWTIHKKIAREIHGGIQSKLQVLALKLSKSESTQAEIFEDFYKELRDSLTSVNSDSKTSNLKGYLTDLAEFWSGIATINISISDEITESIQHGYLLQECIQEVVREAVNNAVKHGFSKAINISITKLNSRTIQIIVKNDTNNSISTSETNKSLGTNIYDELTKSWSLEVGQSETIFSAQFALK